MHTDVLMIGQGIAGTLLSAELLQQGKSVMVIDMPTEQQTSIVAAAVINPLIGKHWAPATDTATLIPAAITAYNRMEQLLGARFLYQKSLLVFLRNAQEETNFRRQISMQNPYTELLSAAETGQLNQGSGDYPVGKINPVYTVDAELLLRQWRQYLESKTSFREEQFDRDELTIHKGVVTYKDIRADKLVFCEGASGRHNPFFPDCPFTANRGDALLLSVPGLAADFLYQKGIRLVPRSDGLFWCGSNYTWQYKDLQADLLWQQETLNALKTWLKLPFELVHHLVAERPTTAGQVPLLMQHSQWPQLFCFNGLGTRGFSAGPYLAQKMVDKLFKP
ncbi:MAG TPA: FAD-binding oxidoreductase [Chitinophagaceae bacterium]|nr:FAD-binding oxidoreductase [Chitinophagaceae bacterium]